jgi:hypothetical protein
MDADMTEELERLLAAATPGPWKHIPGKRMVFVVAPECHVYSNRDNDDGEGPHHPNTIKRWNADAALIVAAINALPGLIAAARELDAARAELAEIRAWTDDNQRGLTAAVADAMWYWDDMPMDCDDAISLTSILKNSLRDNGFQIVRLTAALKGT